jgi:hypothetical protein
MSPVGLERLWAGKCHVRRSRRQRFSGEFVKGRVGTRNG